MSRGAMPKQLIPFIRGRSLLALAWERLEGLAGPDRRWICAGEAHRAAALAGVPGLDTSRFLGEPEGRDTLNALAFASAVIQKGDPEAVVGVFTADQLIEPADVFRRVVSEGYELAEDDSAVLVTFGIAPTHAATGYGYLSLGSPLRGAARSVEEFREKPDLATAQQWVAAGPERFLWNSGMFVFSARGFLDCVGRYEPECRAGMARIADAWGTPAQAAELAAVYPRLRKISVDFAVMERASRDPAVKVAALPMALSWADIGSWPAFADTCEKDGAGNALAAEKCLLLDTRGTLVASSTTGHLIAALGCDDLIIVHTPTATLVCRKDRAEDVKKLQSLAAERFGADYV